MERDLCLGGVEISNPCRTWAYLTGIGNRCFNGGGAPCCPGVAYSSTAYSYLGHSGGANWSVSFIDPIDGLVLAGARRMTLGVYTPPAAPCEPPEELPERHDPAWTLYAPPGVLVPSPASVVPALVVVPTGVGVATCTLYAFDMAVDGMAVGTLWVLAYAGGAVPPVTMWQFADGTATAWGPAGSTTIEPRIYTDPISDAAPWYDPLDARSADVLGVWIDDIVIGRPHTRTVQGRQWGGSLSATRYGAREITIGGRIYVRNRAAGAYAQQWLYEALVGSPCGDGGCNPPSLQLTQWYDGVDPEAGVVWAHEVGLTDWQAVLDTEEPADCFVSFTATLAAQIPWLTRAPRLVVDEQLMQSDPFCDHCGNGTDEGECSSPDPDPANLDCGCGDTPPLPVTLTNGECYVRPIWVARHFVEIESPKLWTDGALRISVIGGLSGAPSSPSVKNLRFRVYHDPQGLGVAAGNEFICAATPCADVSIGCVPYGATLVVDGSMRRGWVESNGSQRSADPYLSSNGGAIIWPEYACGSLLIAVDTDALQTTGDSTYTIETVELQRA